MWKNLEKTNLGLVYKSFNNYIVLVKFNNHNYQNIYINKFYDEIIYIIFFKCYML